MRTDCLRVICILTSLAWCRSERCGSPLHLTPLIDAGNITEALELSEVKDPQAIIPTSYAGFITTDKKAKNHLFFWFFPSLNDTNAPLMVWLNGGPAISSMFGLLYENGPIRVTRENVDNVTYERRPNSWAGPFSMLYIDNPVGTGFSYSETHSSRATQDEYSEELYLFLEQFYLMFPVYLSRELYIGGQSYAGKYVPAIAHRIHTRILAGKSNIPLTGIYLGGPFFDPLIQSAEFCEFYYSFGAISHSRLIKCKQDVSKLGNLSSENIKNMTYYEQFRMAFPNIIGRWSNNYIANDQPGYRNVHLLMNSPAMTDMLHTCDLLFVVDSNHEREAFKSDLLKSTKSKMAVILDNYKVLLYTGDYDGIITSPMVEAALMTTPWSQQEEYNKSNRSLWMVKSDLRGFYTRVGNFCRVAVYKAGHQTPHDQPESSLNMMVDFVRHGCIQP